MKKVSERTQNRGLSIFYFGKGKGKSTAVMGLVARAAGAGMNVHIIQFVKSKRIKKGEFRESGEWPLSSEIVYFECATEALKTYANSEKIGKITTEQVGLGFVGILGDKKERALHVAEAKRGLKVSAKAIKSKNYGLVLLDELVSALELNLISESEVLRLIKSKPKNLHLAYTGHNRFEKIIAISDLVSDITMVKHPYYQGILAKRGIDF